MYCDWPILGRCCFCMPLRRGVLTFGYINLIFSAFMVGIYSYSVHADAGLFAIYHGTSVGISIPEGVCVAIYCFEVVFTAVLLYGTHKGVIQKIKPNNFNTCVQMYGTADYFFVITMLVPWKKFFGLMVYTTPLNLTRMQNDTLFIKLKSLFFYWILVDIGFFQRTPLSEARGYTSKSKKLINYIKTYYYFAVTTTVASVLVQVIDFAASVSSRMGFYMVFEVLPLMFAALSIQVYLIILLRSLLKKMEESEPHGYENQLQQIVYEGKVESNGVYDPTVVPVDI